MIWSRVKSGRDREFAPRKLHTAHPFRARSTQSEVIGASCVRFELPGWEERLVPFALKLRNEFSPGRWAVLGAGAAAIALAPTILLIYRREILLFWDAGHMDVPRYLGLTVNRDSGKALMPQFCRT